MYNIAVSLALALTPAVLVAQVSARAQSQTRADAQAQTGKGAHASASSSTSVEAEVAVARKRNLPEQPIRRRAAEGRAKGASEAQIASAAARMRANLEAAQEAMVRAGRRNPSDEECERGAYALERGYTRAQLEAVARSAPNDRSLVVAFDVLTKLAARGVPVGKALAEVQTKLRSRAPDAQIAALVTTQSHAGVGVGRGVQGSATGAGSAAAGAAASGAGAAAGATGAATGTVGGIIKKP